MSNNVSLVTSLPMVYLLNSYQSAYTKHYSTESTLLSVHNHIINDMSQQKITALCLLDLSAAFDAIAHSILFLAPSVLMVRPQRDCSFLASILSVFTQFRRKS